MSPIRRLRQTIWRYHDEMRSRTAIQWPYLWKLDNFHGLIWLLVFSITVSVLLFCVDVVLVTTHVLSRIDERQFVGGIVVLNALSTVAYFSIISRVVIIYDNSEMRSRGDPLLRSVPTLCDYNSSVIAYVLMLTCLLPVVLERAIGGYVVLSQFNNGAAVALATVASSFSVLVVRRSRNIVKGFTVDPLITLVVATAVMLVSGGTLLFLAGMLIIGGLYFLASHFPDFIASIGTLDKAAFQPVSDSIVSIFGYGHIVWKLLLVAALVGIFCRCAYRCFDMIVRPRINSDGLKQIDMALSMVLVCNAIVTVVMFLAFDGRYYLVFLLLCVSINCLPALISDFYLRKVALEPREVEMW